MMSKFIFLLSLPGCYEWSIFPIKISLFSVLQNNQGTIPKSDVIIYPQRIGDSISIP